MTNDLKVGDYLWDKDNNLLAVIFIEKTCFDGIVKYLCRHIKNHYLPHETIYSSHHYRKSNVKYKNKYLFGNIKNRLGISLMASIVFGL